MKTGLITLTINTENLESMISFLNCLGVDFKAIPVKGGTVMHKGMLGHLEIALISIPKNDHVKTPDYSLRIQVDQIEEVVKKISKHPDVQILMDLHRLKDGNIAIVLDPDGRSVEIQG